MRDWDRLDDFQPLAVGAVQWEQSHDPSIQGRESSLLVNG